MKLSLFQFRVISLAVLFLKVSGISTLDRRNMSSIFQNSWNEVKQEFENEIAKHVAENLPQDGIIAQLSLGYTETPPIRSTLKKSGVQSEVIAALYYNDNGRVQPEAFNFTQARYGNWSNSWFGVALTSFDATVEIDIDLSASADGDLTLSLLKIPGTYDGVGVELEFQLYMTASAKAEMSFTTGLELKMVNPSALMIPALSDAQGILDLRDAKSVGFSINDFTLTPIFNASMPSLEFTASLALRTVLSLNVEGVDVGALTLDLPAFDLTVETLHGRTSNCQHPPPGTPPDQIYAELIHLSATVDAILDYELLDDTFNGTIGTWPMADLLDECYAFLPGSGVIGAVPTTSTDPVLSEKPVAMCTIDGKPTVISALKGLSTAEKAGIIVGVIFGISLIAALAFYGGRASQRHDTKQHRVGIDGAEKSRLAAADRSYSSLPALPPVRRIASESGSLLAGPDAEAQMQERRQSWLKRKTVPSAAIGGLEKDIADAADMPLTGQYDTSRME